MAAFYGAALARSLGARAFEGATQLFVEEVYHYFSSRPAFNLDYD